MGVRHHEVVSEREESGTFAHHAVRVGHLQQDGGPLDRLYRGGFNLIRHRTERRLLFAAEGLLRHVDDDRLVRNVSGDILGVGRLPRRLHAHALRRHHRRLRHRHAGWWIVGGLLRSVAVARHRVNEADQRRPPCRARPGRCRPTLRRRSCSCRIRISDDCRARPRSIRPPHFAFLAIVIVPIVIINVDRRPRFRRRGPGGDGVFRRVSTCSSRPRARPRPARIWCNVFSCRRGWPRPSTRSCRTDNELADP